MRIAVTGATGNLGTSVLGALGLDHDVEEIIGIARRRPDLPLPKVRWEKADVTSSDLTKLFAGVDAVVHLAWKIQPSHSPHVLRATNVTGSRRVFRAAAEARVPSLVYVSSIGAYSPGPKKAPGVTEDWPTNGVITSEYGRDKAEVERLLDRFESEHPDVRCVRLRPALIFKRESAAEIHRVFLGRLVPGGLLRLKGLPLIPSIPDLTIQAVHASDVAEAVHAAVRRDVRGAFNLAAPPVLDPKVISEALSFRTIPIPSAALRMLVSATWKARLHPTDPAWVDVALQAPVMSTQRAEAELDWDPAVSATQALRELLDGIAYGRGFATPPMHAPRHRAGTASLGVATRLHRRLGRMRPA